ncbi:MAG: redoxin domain-containing protein [bacterium]|nr:redoxin domain-containing protein [bacterium]
MKNSKLTLLLLIVAVLSVGMYIYRLRREVSVLKANLPYLLVGEKIDHLDLIGIDGKAVNATDLDGSDGATHIFMVFQTPCSSCNKNLPIWNKLAVLSKGTNAKVYGIVHDEPAKALEFAETKAAIFDIYHPADRETFRDDLRVRLNLPQTIVYRDGEVKFIALGILERENYIKIKSFLEEKTNAKEDH